MAVIIQIPATLRAYCQETNPELRVSASSVREALDELAKSHPAIYPSFWDESGAIRRHIHLFVNNTLVSSSNGLDTELQSDDVLSIMPAVSGG